MNATLRALVIPLLALTAFGCKGPSSPVAPPLPPDPPVSSSAVAEVDGSAWKANLAHGDTLAEHYWMAVDADGRPVEKHWGVIAFAQFSDHPGPADVASAIGMGFWGDMAPGTFVLGDPADRTPGHGAGQWSVDGGGTHTEWTTDAAHTGRLVITAVDAANHRVSGTFEFTAVNGAGGSEVHVRTGTFQGAYAEQPHAPQATSGVALRMRATSPPH